MTQDGGIRLKRLAESERKARTELIKSYLSSAKGFVSLGTFLFGHPDVISWVPEGLRVYLAIGEADIEFTKSDAVADPGKYAWKRTELADNAASRCLLRAIPGHHLKYVLIDPFTEYSKGLLLTSNLTPSGVGVDSPFDAKVPSHEIALELSTSETHDLSALAKFSLFGAKGVREFKMAGLQPVLPLPLALESPRALLINGFGHTSLTQEMLSCVSRAKSSIKICTYTFDEESPLFPLILDRLSKGVEVVVLLNASASNGRIAGVLVRAGAKVILVEKLHAKAVFADDIYGVVSTANFCRAGLAHGINIGVCCSVSTPARIELLREFFRGRTLG